MKGLPKGLLKKHHGDMKAAWREAKGRKKRRKSRSPTKTKRRKISMPRRKKRYSRRRGTSAKTLMKGVVLGIGAGAVVSQLLGRKSPMVNAAAGFLIGGGLPGAVGGFMGDQLIGIGGNLVGGLTGAATGGTTNGRLF